MEVATKDIQDLVLECARLREERDAAITADRARIAQAIRGEMCYPSGTPDKADAILARLLRVVEGG